MGKKGLEAQVAQLQRKCARLEASNVKKDKTIEEVTAQRMEFKKERTRFKRESAEYRAKYEKSEREKADMKKREDELWSTKLGQDRHTTRMPKRLLFVYELLESILSNGKDLRRLTRLPKEPFFLLLERQMRIIELYEDVPHFRDDDDRSSDSGNQSKLYVRHFLLLSLIRLAHNWTQEELGVFFGINQSTVSRYLALANKYADLLYPTPNDLTGYIRTTKSRAEFKEIVPGPDGGEITIDGTLVETTRPVDGDEQKKQYSGKAKMFAISTGIFVNKYNYIIGITDSREGSCHDINVLTRGLPDFGEWLERMISGEKIPKSRRIRLLADGGYAGLKDYLLGVTAKIPHKKPKGGKLTATQKAQNRAHSRKRVRVENVFAHIKNWRRISGRYDGTAEEFNAEFNAVCGLYNMRKMWQDGTYHYWDGKIRKLLGI